MKAVDSSYVHHPKQAVPRGLLRIGTSTLKFYHVEKPGEPVFEAVDHKARAFLADEGGHAIGLDADHGFVLLHRCGRDFHFLLAAAWRGANEVWEAVWYRQGDMPGFAPFPAAYPQAHGALRPTFCVWELGAVIHESAAWTRFLASPRGADDLARWRDDWFEEQV